MRTGNESEREATERIRASQGTLASCKGTCWAAEIVRHQSRELAESPGVQQRGKVVEARGELVMGCAAEGILHHVDENNVDLILMSELSSLNRLQDLPKITLKG